MRSTFSKRLILLWCNRRGFLHTAIMYISTFPHPSHSCYLAYHMKRVMQHLCYNFLRFLWKKKKNLFFSIYLSMQNCCSCHANYTCKQMIPSSYLSFIVYPSMCMHVLSDCTIEYHVLTHLACCMLLTGNHSSWCILRVQWLAFWQMWSCAPWW